MNSFLTKLSQRVGVSPNTLVAIVGGVAAAAVVTVAALSFSSAVPVEQEPAATPPLTKSPPAGGSASSSDPAPSSSSDAPMPKEKFIRVRRKAPFRLQEKRTSHALQMQVLERTHEELTALGVRLIEEMQRMSESGVSQEEMQSGYQSAMERLIREAEDKVGEEFGISKPELVKANQVYQEDPDVRVVLDKIKLVLFGENGGPMEMGEVPSDMTADDVRCVHRTTAIPGSIRPELPPSPVPPHLIVSSLTSTGAKSS